VHFLSLSALWLVAVVLCNASEVRIHHRIARGHGKPPSFTFRGTIDIDYETNTAKYIVADSGLLSLGNEPFHDCCLYQVALERPGFREEDWTFTSTKACFLTTRVADSIAVILNRDGTPMSLNYDILGTASNGACPNSHTHAKNSHAHSRASQSAIFTNTTVSLTRPHQPPLPILKAPPLMTPDGKPVVPPPEKSLIQKYWIYAVPVLMLLLLAPEEDPGASRAK